jgi:mRNA interferase RelE/StbE
LLYSYVKHLLSFVDEVAVSYTRSAIKALKKVPQKDRDVIMGKLDNYAAGGNEDVKALQGSDFFRLRHGSWRAVFSQDAVVIMVLNVAKRGEVYR